MLTPNHILLNVEIVTERLLLQPISIVYEDDIFKEFNEEITTYTYPCPARDISETRSFIEDSIAGMKNEKDLHCVILDKDTQEFLGCAGIHNINGKSPELGIWLKKSAHGNGYGLETIAALKKWADNNLEYEQLIYPVDKANIPSKRIPEKLSGKIAREFEQVNLSGRVLQIIEFRIPKN
ncbi:GNAT family N-acetyltransferase [Hyella patelloides]|nr:GNAT family N-acetyltransferase [Hyella patelloides]